MQRLHQQSTYSTDQSSEICMDYPWGIGRHKESGFVTSSDYLKPRRNTIWVAREQAAKPFGKVFL
jgi:hypothetical protein